MIKTTGFESVQYGPERPSDADGSARVTSCERVGPISRGGIGAELGTHRLPGEKGAYRLPEAFSDAAASQVREAMAVYQPDRFRVFTAEIDETMVTA